MTLDKKNQLKELFSQWQSGRITDFTNVVSGVDLKDVPDFFVITTYMPVDNEHVTAVKEGKKAQARTVLHAFSCIGELPLPGGNGSVVGNMWCHGAGLTDAMPFPSKALAMEFDKKVIDLPGTIVMPVKEFLNYIPKS